MSASSGTAMTIYHSRLSEPSHFHLIVHRFVMVNAPGILATQAVQAVRVVRVVRVAPVTQLAQVIRVIHLIQVGQDLVEDVVVRVVAPQRWEIPQSTTTIA